MEAKDKNRVFLSIFFFLSGICFSTWASRIPTIKNNFHYNEAELGTILIFMPISSLIGLPISGWLVSRYDSRIPLAAGFVMLSVALACIGWATTSVALVASICLFAFSLRMLNISANTQALGLQQLFQRKINGSFHGLWSTGGIVGICITTTCLAREVSIGKQLSYVAVLALLVTAFSYRFLIRNDRSTSGNRLVLSKPDPYIMYLGLMVFFASVCEGGMFDWSGIYFKEVVHEEIFTLGYLSFMICMALSRFASDRIVEAIGMTRTYIMSASVVVVGITLAIAFPMFWPSLIGFCLVGLGTAAVIPLTYTLASGSRKYSPGMAISIITTYGIAGVFIGPPLIGYIAHAFNLRVSFVAFGLAGFMLIPISQRFFRYQRSLDA
ncbi:MFS transporter [Dawidia soli]|uniref:MFS transporter n=1 Tax=Dawidia soli TaxID=2782352 RepID=A0AAP2DDK8_9BACT|nr:MFS transporter [Dawidia soli]MBT1688780.1 MFS transporter [Dawidia soli]